MHIGIGCTAKRAMCSVREASQDTASGYAVSACDCVSCCVRQGDSGDEARMTADVGKRREGNREQGETRGGGGACNTLLCSVHMLVLPVLHASWADRSREAQSGALQACSPMCTASDTTRHQEEACSRACENSWQAHDTTRCDNAAAAATVYCIDTAVQRRRPAVSWPAGC